MFHPPHNALPIRAVLWSAFGCLALACQTAHGGWVGHNFTASVTFKSSTSFGIPLTTVTPITGQFVFDTNTPPQSLPAPIPTSCTGAGTSCLVYRQHYPGGFTATFGGISVSADDYLVIVSNHLPQVGFPGVFADTVNIRWVSNLTLSPPLAPLTVQGIPRSAGMFTLNLQALDTVLLDASLPSSLTSFSTRVGILADPSPTLGAPDILFSIAPLTAFQAADPPGVGLPEPGCGMLLALGLGLVGVRQFVRGRRVSPAPQAY